MAKQVIILVHGMGNHSAPKLQSNERGSFGKECIDSLNNAMQMYPSLQSEKIEDHVNFVEIFYNDKFDIARQQMADNGQKFSDFLATAGASTALANIPGIVKSIVDFESSLGSDKFIYTHWMDVLLYKLFFGEYVRLHVAEKLGDVVSKNSTRNIHVLAHSLGTAVIHDTLAKVYRGDYVDNDEIVDLSPTTHKLASLWQVANVSRLANSVLKIADPYKSIVRPGAEGAVLTMMNIHHKLDPFTLIKSYARKNDGKWIKKSVYNSAYLDIQTSSVTDLNTHSITQYLHDPAVHLYLFRRLGIQMPKKSERDAAFDAYDNSVINQAKEKLEARLQNLTRGNAATFKDYFEAARMLYQVIQEG